MGNLDILKLLLSPKASSSSPFQLRRPGSLLSWTITCSHAHIVEYLVLKKRLEADCFDEDGNNSVGIASLVLAGELSNSSSTSHPGASQHSTLKRILKLLLLCEGIEINHKNMYGLTPFDVAESKPVKHLLAHLGGKTARVLNMEKLLRWDRERSREEYTYSRNPLRRAIVLKNTPPASGP